MKVIHNNKVLGKQAANKEKNAIKRCEGFPGNLLLQWTAQFSLMQITSRVNTQLLTSVHVGGPWLPGSLDFSPGFRD